MGLFGNIEQRLSDKIDKLRSELTEIKLKTADAANVLGLKGEITELQKKLAALQIDKSRLDEANQRERRETTHMVGLERKRQEVEVSQAKRDAILGVREETLTASEKRFDERMKFQKEQFDGQVSYLQELMAQILTRLPIVTVDVDRSVKSRS